MIDTFSGIGGFSLAAEWTGRISPVQFIEIDPWCRRVLAKHWPEVPQHDDIRTFLADAEVRGLSGAGQGSGDAAQGTVWGQTLHGGDIDLLTGGFPCQPFSAAGKRQGAGDDRYLWPELHRLVLSVRPRWCLFENVPGIIGMAGGLDRVLADLEAGGYACGAVVVPAAAVGAHHRRDRVWIVAHSERGRRDAPWEDQSQAGQSGETRGTGDTTPLDDAQGGGRGLRHALDLRPAAGDEHAPGDAGDVLPDSRCEGQPARRIRGGTTTQGEMGDVGIADGGPARNGRPCSGHEALGGVGGAADGLPRRLARVTAARAAAPRPRRVPQHRLLQQRRELVHRAAWRDAEPECSLEAWASSVKADARWEGDPRRAFGPDWEADLARVTAFEADRVNKLKALGNAIVPQVAYELMLMLLAVDDGECPA